MLEFGFAKEQESKQKRRKSWIRYERKYSLSAVYIDEDIVAKKIDWENEDDALTLFRGYFSNYVPSLTHM